MSASWATGAAALIVRLRSPRHGAVSRVEEHPDAQRERPQIEARENVGDDGILSWMLVVHVTSVPALVSWKLMVAPSCCIGGIDDRNT